MIKVVCIQVLAPSSRARADRGGNKLRFVREAAATDIFDHHIGAYIVLQFESS